MPKKRKSLNQRFGSPDIVPRLRIICETIGPGKANLLGHIAETHSISESARRMGITYKHAWELIDSLNSSFLQHLVATKVGGAKGGGAHLTENGVRILDLYSKLYKKCCQAGESEWHAIHQLLRKPKTEEERRIH